MKKYFFVCAFIFSFKILLAQISSTPSKDLEYCPVSNTTFTVIVQGYEPFVFGWTNNPIIISANYPPVNVTSSTTFTFVGRFKDVNIAQTFGVRYKRQNKADTTEYITFKKIKSLFYPNPTGSSGSSPCQPFTANQTFITAPICQVTNATVSVNAAKWSTFSEGNDFCWGSITTYEYQLPINWKVGTTFTSTGSNWYAGGTSVTVTSDLTNGTNGVIRIRPVNNCGAGLANNATQVNVSIIRPKPTLTFNAVTPICSTATFQANNVPAWVNNTLWSVAPLGLVSIATPTSNPATFTKVGNGTATVQFAINGGATCPVSFNYNTQEIVNDTKLEVGAPVATWPEVFYPTTNCLPMGFNVTYTSTSQFSAWFEWGYYEGPSGNGSPYVLINGAYTSQQPIRISNGETINRIVVKGGNACGTGVPNIREFTFTSGCNAGGDVEYRINPKEDLAEIRIDKFSIFGNPANAVLNVKVPKSNKIQQIVITDVNGRQLKTLRNIKANFMKIEIFDLKAGLYFITLTSNNKKQVLKFIKQ